LVKEKPAEAPEEAGLKPGGEERRELPGRDAEPRSCPGSREGPPVVLIRRNGRYRRKRQYLQDFGETSYPKRKASLRLDFAQAWTVFTDPPCVSNPWITGLSKVKARRGAHPRRACSLRFHSVMRRAP
jgi:hypothetical protein